MKTVRHSPAFWFMMVVAGLTINGCTMKPTQHDAEVCIINNTYHQFLVYQRTDPSTRRAADTLLPGERFTLQPGREIADTAGLRMVLNERLVKVTDHYLVDWLPRINQPGYWNHIDIPGKGGMKVYFILMNRNDDTLERLQELGMIKLFRIAEGLAYFLVLTTIVGLLYLRLPYRWPMVLVVLLLNLPVIYYTADFGMVVKAAVDPFFIFPRWIYESTRYYVRFSIPVGAVMVWCYLLAKRWISWQRG